MADLGTFRPFIVAVVFMGTLVTLIGIMNLQTYAGETSSVVTPEDYWEAQMLIAKNYTDVLDVNITWVSQGSYGPTQIGGRWVKAIWVVTTWPLPTGEPYISVWHFFGLTPPWGGPPLQHAEFDWYKEGIKVADDLITATKLDTDYALGSFDGITYVLREGSVQLDVSFMFDANLYNSPLQAWQNSALHLVFGIEWEYAGTALNAWDIVGMLLFYDLPNVHPVINSLLKVPIWAAVAILAFTFVTAIIPFIRGL